MEDQNRALGAAGAPIRLPAGDKTYLLSVCTKRVQTDFQEWLKERAKREVLTIQELSPDQVGMALAKIAQDAAAGVYAWNGTAGLKARSTWEGIAQVLYLLLRRNHPEIQPGGDEIEQIMEEHTESAAAAIKESIDRGNRKSAAPTPAAAA